MVEDISDACRKEIYNIVTSVSTWISSKHEATTEAEFADMVRNTFSRIILLELELTNANSFRIKVHTDSRLCLNRTWTRRLTGSSHGA